LNPQAPDRPILIAVSGGSDSVALMHWLAQNHAAHALQVATVDHGLRKESALEAETVKAMATSLHLPHHTLVWTPPSSPSSAEMRDARYSLLLDHAAQMGAGTIALGHTLDDQAETVWMRALRHQPASDTRGLSGMAEWSHCGPVALWRPLLNMRRATLRDQLLRQNLSWCDDPSNENIGYERVRLRNSLKRGDTVDAEPLAHLATLSMRMRTWLHDHVADTIDSCVTCETSGQLRFTPPAGMARPIVAETLSVLILVAGGLSHRTPTAKFSELVAHQDAGRPVRQTVGRCLITAGRGTFTIERENRNNPPFPDRVNSSHIHDGRFLLQPYGTAPNYRIKPYIQALEMFRPRADNPVHRAVYKLLNSVDVQHKERF